MQRIKSGFKDILETMRKQRTTKGSPGGDDDYRTINFSQGEDVLRECERLRSLLASRQQENDEMKDLILVQEKKVMQLGEELKNANDFHTFEKLQLNQQFSHKEERLEELEQLVEQ